MKFTRARLLLLALIPLCLPTMAKALPGDAAAVLTHCGAPTRDFQVPAVQTPAPQGREPASRIPERILLYSQIQLHFRPIAGDWSYIGAAEEKLQLSPEALARRMPCVGDALEEVAAKPAAQSFDTDNLPDAPTDAVPQSGIPYSTLFPLFLFLLIAVVIGFAIRPYSRRSTANTTRVPQRKYRKPSSEKVTPARRRPELKTDLDETVSRGTPPPKHTIDQP